uniref:Uncharacterized protein n=1 Tax=Acrobeloides nanus TaxID=290746 RepID=A0A914CV11_9BILA
MDLEEAKDKLIEARKLQEDRDKEKKLAENRVQLNLHYSRFLELELNMLSPFAQDRLKNGINELLRVEKMGTNYNIIYDRPVYQEVMYSEGAAQNLNQ